MKNRAKMGVWYDDNQALTEISWGEIYDSATGLDSPVGDGPGIGVCEKTVVVAADGSGCGAVYRTRAGLRRPKMNVMRPSSSSFLTHGNETVGVGGVDTADFGSEGADRWLCKRERRLLEFVGVRAGDAWDEDGVTVKWGTGVSEATTSSANSSNPGSGLIILLVEGLALGVRFCDGMGNERSVRDEQGGNENVPAVQVVADTAWIMGEGVGLPDDFPSDLPDDFPEDWPDDLPEEDVEAGMTDEEDVELDSLEQEPLVGLDLNTVQAGTVRGWCLVATDMTGLMGRVVV
ncbi:hypothetical protein FRC08_009770, partial [Ceratobasidium sp. 394]